MRMFNPKTGELEIVEPRAYMSYDTRAASRAVAQENTEPSKTVQADAHEADINTIVDRLAKTGQMPIIQAPPQVDEFADIFDFTSAMQTIAAAKYAFSQLPAKIQARFNHNPAEYVAFADDPENIPELRKWGVAVDRERRPGDTAPAPLAEPPDEQDPPKEP